jgi:transcriptional regulator MraZ
LCGAAGQKTLFSVAMSSNDTTQRICYTSTYTHGLDDKRRVQIPARWRPAQEETELALILWKQNGPGNECVLVLPPERWAALVAPLTAMRFSDPDAEALRRSIGRDTEHLTLDKSGRVCLPERLAKAAGIEKQATFVGLLDSFQIWAPERYERVSSMDDSVAPRAINRI